MDRINDLFIGGVSGAWSRTLTAPLELLKIQAQNKFMKGSTLSETIRNEGLRGLWKGNLANSIRIFPQNAINYATYSYAKDHIFSNVTNNKLKHFASGSFGGMVAMISIYPLENIRTRLSLQVKNSHYNGIRDSFKKIPFRQLYQGLGMSLIGFMPYNGLNFMFYSFYK